MNTRRTLGALVCLLLAFGPLACPKDGTPPKNGAGATSSSTTVTIVSASSGSSSTSASSDATSDGVFSLGSVKAPVLSDDPCAKDSDCAPVGTCHPDRCVATANAGTLAPGTMCTETCTASTLDCGYNHCGCASAKDGQKRCAVLPGPGKKS